MIEENENHLYVHMNIQQVCQLTIDPPMLVLKGPLTCQFYSQEQAMGSHWVKVSSRGHEAHFEL